MYSTEFNTDLQNITSEDKFYKRTDSSLSSQQFHIINNHIDLDDIPAHQFNIKLTGSAK